MNASMPYSALLKVDHFYHIQVDQKRLLVVVCVAVEQLDTNIEMAMICMKSERDFVYAVVWAHAENRTNQQNLLSVNTGNLYK